MAKRVRSCPAPTGQVRPKPDTQFLYCYNRLHIKNSNVQSLYRYVFVLPWSRNYFFRVILVGTWAVVLGTGFWRLFSYANRPGESANSGARWPAATKLVRDSATPTVLLFAHPQCPCSQASVGELERLIPHIREKARVMIVFFKPRGRSDEWAKDSLWRKASNIPGVQTLLDEDGIESNRFGAKTSGQVLLFDTQGLLVFRGGITSERGHMGDSPGRNAILAFLQVGKSTVSETPVFGCSLRNPERTVAGRKDL